MPGMLSKLKSRLKPEDTQERCGLILGRGQVVEVENLHPDPSKGFAISVSEMHNNSKTLKGTWHTHPGQSSVLSQDDYLGFSNWPGLTHYIIGIDGVRAYQADASGIVTEVACS